jgi:hypothetical protein
MILAVPVILPWAQSGLLIVEVKELNDTLPIETNLPMHPGSTILAAPDDDTSASSIPRPLSLSQFLSLDGSRAMQGDLDMDDHAIKNLNYLPR